MLFNYIYFILKPSLLLFILICYQFINFSAAMTVHNSILVIYLAEFY